ncbi:MAG: Holliday junction resolvase RuvX [Candidatus Paceibacterota bacterium]|jgi:putative Holliday junction resolvase
MTMRYLGIDYGNRKVGLAISDEAGSFAFPYQVIKNEVVDKLVGQIEKICDNEGINAIVLGESVDLAGQANPIQKEILAFKEKLEKEVGREVILEKELFTTQEARRGIDEGGTDPATDARAAALILKSYLEKTRQ